MFDYQVSKHPHFDEACRAFALRHNLVQLAERAGMNVQILRNKLNPAQPHLLTAPEIWLLTDLTEDSTLVPVITITRKDGDSHRFTLADRRAYTGVIASWLHTREPAKKESTTVKRKRRTAKQKKEPEAKQGDYLVGTDENVLVLNRTYANRSNAERAAKMQWERLQRGVASFSLQLAEGRADLYTEMPVKVSGFKQPIDDAEWTITTLTHNVSPDNGFTTSLELEVRIDDFEME
ncbi:hypothetical protein FH413_002117 [Escherichia coli]|nr:hypothetical protein [Escherichia coli]